MCSLRLPGSIADVEQAFGDINELVSTTRQAVWTVGSSATPKKLVDQLQALGLRDPAPPMDPVCAAMVLTDEPDDVQGLDVRRIQTLAEHLAGLEILLTAATWSDSAAADERARAEEVFDRRTRRGGHQWLAWHGDQPVAYAFAERTTAGIFLAGGATLPEARGHGCYRALVRARCPAWPPRPRGPGAVRHLSPDPPQTRIHRSGTSAHPAVVTCG